MKSFLKCLLQKENKIVPKKKVVLVVGHHRLAMGARAFNGIPEYEYWSEVCERVSENIDNRDICEVVYRDGTNIAGAIMRAAELSPNIIIECHFNAFNGQAHGAESLVTHPTTIASEFLEGWCRHAELRSRGLKVVSNGQAGFTSVNTMKQLGVEGFLFEAFFGDNPDDYRPMGVVEEYLTEWILKLNE